MPKWRRNEYRNGIEITFEKKPSYEVLSKLKTFGWRWNHADGCWYTKYTAESLKFAKQLCLPTIYQETKYITRKTAQFIQKDSTGNISNVTLISKDSSINISSSNGLILCICCNNFINISFQRCPYCGCNMSYIASRYLEQYGTTTTEKVLVTNKYTTEEAECLQAQREILKLKEKYSHCWKSEFEKTSYYDIEELEKELVKLDEIYQRKLDISKINKVYLQNCGYSIAELENMYSWQFQTHAKNSGSNETVAFKLLKEKVPVDALDMYKKRYLLFFELQDSEYRNRLEESFSASHAIVRCPRCNRKIESISKQILCSQCSPLYGLNQELNKLNVNQGVFWEYLKVFGNKLQPINRVAASVAQGSNYEDNVQRNYVDEIINKLTFKTVDTVTRIIKPIFMNDVEQRLEHSLATDDKSDFYFCALYSYILGNEDDEYTYLKKYISYETAEEIIKKFAKHTSSLH